MTRAYLDSSAVFAPMIAAMAAASAWMAGCGSSRAERDVTTTADGGAVTTSDASIGVSIDAAPAPETGVGSTTVDGSLTARPDGGIACGDRNVGVREAYPASFRIQNGGRVYDVTAPPMPTMHAAKGDGVTDDTAALLDAWDYVKQSFLDHKSWAYGGGPIVYLPNGTYVVGDTIIYRGASLEAPTGYAWVDVVDVRFAGESREGTILKLQDHAPGFGDPKNPKIVLAYQHPGTRFNNIPGNNSLRNLTVDVGSGNPGAVGVAFQGANLTAMRNVLVRSDDGGGRYGFWFRLGSAQGHYKDLTVEGLDYGIFQNENGEVNTSFEHVTLRDQHVAAIEAGAGLSARDVCASETTGAQGLRIDEDGSQGVVVDSEFRGAADAGAVEIAHGAKQSLYLRGVTTSGYASAVVRAGAVAVTGPDVDEWSALPTKTLFDGGAAKSLRLPIEDTPLVAWGDPAADWANVDDYGAAGDGGGDDTNAIQRAVDSGKPVVVFRRSAYVVSKTITVPATVQRLDLMYSDLANVSFDVVEASAAPLLIERGGGYGAVTLRATRSVVLSEMSGHFVDAQTAPTKVYVENAANIGDGDDFAPAGQSMWARSINNEDGPPAVADIVVRGGTAWVFNYKTENKPVTSLLASEGGVVEVLNGYVNSTVDAGATPMIVNDQSNMSFVGYTNLGFYTWNTTIREVRAVGTQSLLPSAFPARDSSDIFVPLYSGDAR